MKLKEIQVARTVDEFNSIATETILKMLKSFENTPIVLALSGGSTPKPIYSKLGELLPTSGINPQNVHLIWVDERWVSYESIESNYKLVKDTLLKNDFIPEENVHPMPTLLEKAQKAIEKYEKTLKELFKKLERQKNFIDICLMGLGADGHTASLFPGISELGNLESYNWVIVPYVNKLSSYRVSLTPKLLNTTKYMLFMVRGYEKASIVKTIMQTKNIQVYPAQLIKPTSGTKYWVLDAQAFNELGFFSV